jgi:lipid A 3-O-deacylase
MAPAAHAGVDEAYVGVMAHDICVIDCKNAWKERGPAVEFQVNFDSPDFLGFIGSPHPYAMASGNVAGATSFAGVGLEWRWQLGEHWSVEPGFGYVIHNGALNNPFPNGTPESQQYFDHHLLLGSRDLFRISLGVTRDLPGPWEVQTFYSHLSHGQILGHGRNQGLDQLGVRLGYRFGE